MKIKKILFILILISQINPGFSKDYYVSKSGSDRNTGTKQSPFLTIQKAAEIMKAGDVCYISTGIYQETVRPKHSGRKNLPLTFKPVSGKDEVVITGTDKVPRESWESAGGKLFRARVIMELTHENQVFMGGQMLVEARWPNTGSDLFNPSLAIMDEGTTPDLIISKSLPQFNLLDAYIWIHAPKYWWNWTTSITGNPGAGKMNIISIPPPGAHVTSNHFAAPGADYYIFGFLDALDSENEWYYDSKEGWLYIYRENNSLPDEPIFVKRRMHAFDLNDLNHISIENISVTGASIITNENSSNIHLDRIKLYYSYHSSKVTRGRTTDYGLILQGNNCIIANSEIAYTAGSAILLQGSYNKIINCYIHNINYNGSRGSGIQLGGQNNLISHCTITKSGGVLISYGGMHKSLIQYCDLSHAGLLTSDLGLTYGNVIEGGNSEIRYNILHENDDPNKAMGLYYDHGTQNIISHHNIIWEGGTTALLINHNAAYHLVYNNTFIARRNEHGFRSVWGNQYAPDLFECRFVNNIFSGKSLTSANNLYWENNLTGYEKFKPENMFAREPLAVDKGVMIEGITTNIIGEGPDIGAVEFGETPWKVGHDFNHPPNVDTTRSKPLHRNMVENSAFEHGDHISPWKWKGNVEVNMQGTKGQATPDTATIRMGRYSIELGNKDAELYQRISGLQKNRTYQFAAHLRVDKVEEAVIGIRYPDGREMFSTLATSLTIRRVTGYENGWQRLVIHFNTLENDSIEVFVRRLTNGQGKVFVDDCGLVMK